MSLHEIIGFQGLVPRINPALLPDNAAQVASNCVFWNKDLSPLLDSSTVVTPTALGSAIRSIYRIGASLGETQYWMAWTGDVDVVPGPVAGDTSELTYFTGDGVPKMTNLTLATFSGSSYPVASYILGIPIPAAAPSCAPSGATAPIETRVYVYTYVSAYGEEGVPSAPTTVNVTQGGTVALSGMSTGPAGNYNIATKRIYRSAQTAGATAIYRFVAEIPVANTTYSDVTSSTELNEELATLDYDMPPSDMTGLVAMPNGFMAAFSGKDICFSEPFKPYAWPSKYRLTTEYDIIGLGVYNTTLVVLTKGYPYIVDGVDPASMSMVRSTVKQSCVAKRSIVSSDDGVIYASPDGLVFIGVGGPRVITQQHFTRKEWQALTPSSITAFWTDGKYVAICTGGNFILDSLEGSAFTNFDDAATAGYVDMVNDALYLCIGGAIKKFNAGSARTYTWRSKKFQFVGRQIPAFARVDANAYPVTFKMYRNGSLWHTQSVTDERPFTIPGDERVRELEIELVGTARIRYAAIADTYEEFPIG